MTSRRKWALIASGILLAGFLWSTRIIVRDCAPDGCVLVNRWTGSVTYQRAARENAH